MSATIVVGGQLGSEGKGKVVQHVLQSHPVGEVIAVRCGGPNSGHTVAGPNGPQILKQLSSGAAVPGVMCVIPPAAVVDHDLLLKEIAIMGLPATAIVVDNRAVVLRSQDIEHEKIAVRNISSTGSGNGEALIRRMRRYGASLIEDMNPKGMYLKMDTTEILQSWMEAGRRVVVEGNQGFGLSLLHGNYPYCTSRDTTASSFASECGIAPSQVDRVICVFRTFPIRVGSVNPAILPHEGWHPEDHQLEGTSGPMYSETTWNDLPGVKGPEYTSVSKRLRRVGLFDWDMARRAIRVNGATEIAIMGLDRLNADDTNVSNLGDLSTVSSHFIQRLEQTLNVPVKWMGTGPMACYAIDTYLAIILTAM